MARQVKRTPGKRAAKKSVKPRKKTARAKTPAAADKANWLNNALNAPMVREAIAAAIVAGAGAAAAVFVKRHGPGAKQVKSAASDISTATRDLAEAGFGVLAGAAAETMKGMLPDRDAGEGRGSAQRRPKLQDQGSQ